MRKSPNIAVIFPSRGTTYSKTVEELLRELKPYKHKIFFAHGLPLPECFNKPLTEALRASEGYSHVWFVEDDMILPEGILSKLLADDKDAVSCDYPLVPHEPSGTILYSDKNTAFFTGTGCMLVKRHVFDKLPKPIFRSDIYWKFSVGVDGASFKAIPVSSMDKVAYGLHDITFGLLMYTKGMPIHVNRTPCGQRKLVKRGKEHDNDGAHEIVELDNLLRHDASRTWRLYKREYPWDGKLTEVQLGDGTMVTVEVGLAQKLLKEKKAIEPYIKGEYMKLDLTEMPELIKEFS